MASPLARLIVLDKPVGVTSFDLVKDVRRVSGVRRVGHGGTLDPFATGVLVIAVGPATRLLRFVSEGGKQYLLTVRFGVATDSHDGTGRVTASGEPTFGEADVRSVLPRFIGEVQQRPPAVSALKVSGQRAYRLQRKGLLEEDLPSRAVHIDAIELVSWTRPDAVLRVRCGGGTYMRALARDLGEALDCPAHAAELRREAVGAFGIDEAIAPTDLAEQWPDGRGMLPAAAIARGWDRYTLSDAEFDRVRHGGPIPASSPSPAERPVALLAADGALAAVARWAAGQWQPTVVLAEAEDGDS